MHRPYSRSLGSFSPRPGPTARPEPPATDLLPARSTGRTRRSRRCDRHWPRPATRPARVPAPLRLLLSAHTRHRATPGQPRPPTTPGAHASAREPRGPHRADRARETTSAHRPDLRPPAPQLIHPLDESFVLHLFPDHAAAWSVRLFGRYKAGTTGALLGCGPGEDGHAGRHRGTSPLCSRRQPVRRWPVTRRGRVRLATDLSWSAARKPPRREFEQMFEHHECTPGPPPVVNHDAELERDRSELFLRSARTCRRSPGQGNQ